ncbi:MAG: NAD(P)-binding protein [Phycisphaerae bacterium]
MEQITGIYTNGVVKLKGEMNWPENAPVLVLYTPQYSTHVPIGDGQTGHAIIAGYGLAGRFIADVFRRHDAPFVVVEKNAKTCQVQRELGANIIEGDIREKSILHLAGIDKAAVLALTIPDDPAVLEATQVARKLNPNIYIVARTQYASVGLQAARLGADEVVQAEYAVAIQFYQSFLRKLQSNSSDSNGAQKQ